MADRTISPERWKILEHFIVNESTRIETALGDSGKVTSNNIEHYSAYPAMVEDDTAISRVTVGKACRQLLKQSIFEISKTTRPHFKGDKSNFYSLKSDLPTIRKLVKLILDERSPSEAKKLLDNYYFTYNLNESLVRKVLFEKGVSISREFNTLDWDINDAQRVINIFERNEMYPDIPDTIIDFSSKIKESVERYEENNKAFDDRYIARLKNFCDELYETLNDPLVDEKKYYFKDDNLYNLSRSKHSDILMHDSPFTWDSSVYPISSFYLKLPVFSDEITERIEKIKESNLDTFYDTNYGYRYVKFKSFPNDLIAKLDNIAFGIKDLQTQILHNSSIDRTVIVKSSELPLANLISIIRDYIGQIEQEKKRCTPFVRFNYLEKMVIESHNLIVEHLNSIRNENTDGIITEALNSIESMFERLFGLLDRFRNIKELNNDYIENNFSNLLKEHYSVFEYEKLILPILTLIHSSPRALDEFLNGDWEPFDLSWSGHQKAQNSEFLTKLIHITFVDFLCSPNILKKGIVESVSFNSYCSPDIDIFGAAGIKDDREYFEYRNDVVDSYYNELSYDRLRRVEIAPLKIRLKNLYELTVYPYFAAIIESEENKISSSLLLDVIPEVEYQFFRVGKLKDANSLIAKLREVDKGACSHIRGLLSTKMQNIIMHYDLSSKPSLKLREELLKELSLVLLKPELYSKNTFDEFAISDNQLKDVIESIKSVDLSFKDLIQMVEINSSRNLSSRILINNRHVLMKMFEDEFEQDLSY